jgi:hypothetical protein
MEQFSAGNTHLEVDPREHAAGSTGLIKYRPNVPVSSDCASDYLGARPSSISRPPPTHVIVIFFFFFFFLPILSESEA